MKITTHGIQETLAVLVVGFVAGYCLSGPRDAALPQATLLAASPQATPVVAQVTDSPKWEYTSESIDAISIRSKLTAMGLDGWEVIAVNTADATLETGADGKSHLTTQRYEITAKRKRR